MLYNYKINQTILHISIEYVKMVNIVFNRYVHSFLHILLFSVSVDDEAESFLIQLDRSASLCDSNSLLCDRFSSCFIIIYYALSGAQPVFI